jgi:chromosome segregation protein
MTGGRYKSKKNAGLLGKRAEIKKLEITYNELAARESEIDGSFDSVRLAKQKLEESIVSHDAKVRELATLRANLEGELKITRERLSEYAGAEEQKEQNKENLRKDRERHGEQVQVLRKEIEELTAKISEVEAEAESDIEKLGAEKDGADGSEVTELSVRLAELGKEKEYAGIDLETIEEIINAGEGDIAAREERLSEIAEEEKRFEEETSVENAKQDADKNRLATDEKLTEINAEREKLKLEEEEKEKEFEASERELEKSREIKIALDMEINRQENRMESLSEKLFAEFTMSYEEAQKLRKDDFVMSRAEKENREAKNRLAEIGPVNIFSIKEYAEVSERYDFMTKQKADILESIEAYEKIVTRMERAIKLNFAESFDAITENFKESFSELFGGGSGEVRLIDSDDPLESGLELVCQPPGKKLQNMNLLSGGEKTMTAIALMFAVLKAKPSPFCILDEIEAALDEKNIIRFCEYLLKFSGVQFTLITHQKATMEYANALYGVSMPEKGVSKLISLRLEGEAN